jgi:acyl dehydratase
MSVRVPEPGMPLPPLPKGRWTSSHIVRWCAAQENWAKIHFDADYARGTAGLPAPLINGALKQHLLAQFLVEGFGGAAYVWRLDYEFKGMDLVGEALEVRGAVRAVERHGSRAFVTVEAHIRNLDRDQSTTLATGIVVLSDGGAVTDCLDASLPDHLRLPTAVGGAEGHVPAHIASRVGERLDSVVSCRALDLGRLRLFADAVMGLRAWHHDPAAAAASPYGRVCAPPLYALHGLEAAPGTWSLSEDPRASGREAVAEMPRDLAARFGIDPSGSLNGGSRIEVHSPLYVGETLQADSTLVGVKHRVGRTAGAMLIFDTVNRFSERGGRPILTERHSSIYRLKTP